ncbi:gamma-aminobutyric acid type B receptor subunit 2-like isoform X2 [Stegodyphus dumicola]|uniref:gamma-aminobutyric acid type B receptor subunit 2-like isoform X2 n=1 Tax=Stegodyphus dumicola TaxID=202533 RepID=UPI0015A89B47|nr:gamma-aminobutyric acid type B receptor subunit 2-like isoform X2 [Stegodyphus dumicola]
MLRGRYPTSGITKLLLYFRFLIPLLMAQVSSASISSQANIHIGAFFPLSFNISEGSIGRGVAPAVKLAARHINSSPLILKDYRLVVQVYDTMCDAAVGMKAFFDMLHQKPHKVILFGAACTAVTDPIAKSSQFFQLVQLTYADTHPMYTNENYPNFFRVVPSETAFNPARVVLLRHFNWTRVGTLYQNSPRYALPHSKLLTDLDSARIAIAETQGLVEELQNELVKLKNKDVRIILGNFDEEWARKIFCEAYRLKMYGRKYQWIIVGMFRERWWEIREPNATCSPWELTQALEGHIATDVLPLSSSENITVSGLTAAEYAGQYDKKREQEYSRFHGYAYDGIWAIALAIQNVAQKLKAKGMPSALKEFQYRDPFWGQLFRDAFNETSFTGVTGPVSFVKNERRGQILLKQFQNGSEVKIGEYDPITDELDLSKGAPIIWSGGSGPPADRTHRKIARKRISITVYSILVTFAVFGIIIATVFLVVNIKYRNQKYIKMSSPYLNNIIVVGCMLTYTSVILLGMDSGLSSESNFPYICAARAWVLMSGFTLAFGSMFSKTWRVHAIFTNIKLNKKIIKDYKLFMVVGVLVMIDVIILTTWQIIDPFYRETSTGAPLPSPENEDIEIIPELEFCQSNNMTIFLGSIYAYKGLLMAFGCFLAWETRHVSIPALNDSKYIGMSVYNVVIMCVIGAALSFVLREQQDAAFIIISIFIMFCSTTTLCLVFVPKLLELWANPHAGDRRVRATLKPLKKSRRSSDESDLQYNMQMLQDENRRYRQRYEDVSLELQKLNLRLREAEEPVILVTHGYDMTSPIVELPSLEVSEEESAEDTFGRRPSMPVKSHTIALQKRRMSEISIRISTMSERESSYARTDESSVQMSSPPATEEAPSFTYPVPQVPRVEEPKPSPSAPGVRYRQLQPLTLMDEASQPVKFADSDSSEGSRKSPGGQNHQEYQESDDTSYARAIQNAQRKRSLMNGLSSSAEEDTDKFEMGTCSEADSDSNARRTASAHGDVRRRAKSLGTLRDATRRTSYGTGGPPSGGQVSVIHNRRTDPGLLPLFPYISHIMNNRKSPNDDESTPLYSSYPSVKCDIVEYL